MINFFVCSDNIFYKTKIESIINECMTKEKICYCILNKIDNNIESKKIYIIDLEVHDIIDMIDNLKKENNIIYLTHDLKKQNILKRRKMKVKYIINKNDDYESLIKKYIKNIIINIDYKKEEIISNTNNINYIIPYEEIDEVILINNKAIIKATNSLNEKYICEIEINNNTFRKKLIKDFINIGDYYIADSKNSKFYLECNNQKYIPKLENELDIIEVFNNDI